MFPKLIFICLATLFLVSESAFVDNLTKCKLGDQTCFKNLVQNVIASIPKDGLPEIGMPSIDPAVINKTLAIKILDSLELSLEDSVLKGIKKCVINKFDIDVNKFKATLDLTCDVTLKGKYHVFSTSSLLRSLTGGKKIHGDGNAKVKITKLNLKFNFFFGFEKRGEDIFVNYKQEKTTYEYNLPEHMVFFADKLYLGNEEASEKILAFINENWKVLVPTFAKDFLDQTIGILSNFIHIFFHNVACKYYFSDDLSSYVA